MSVKAAVKLCKNLGHRLVFNTKKNSPAILMISAGVTGIGCVVSACIATRKLDPVLKNHNETLEEVKEIVANEPEHFDEKQERRMVTKVYAKTALRVAKLYAPATLMGVAAFACATGSYKIQANRITYLSGALAVAEQKLQTYQMKEKAEEVNKIEDPEERKAAAERPIGNDRFMVRWGIGDISFNEPRIYGPYANPQVARQTEEYLNELLAIRGALTWNDVLNAFEKTPYRDGAMAGWIFDPKGGDHQIDLGLTDPRNAAFMSGEDTEGCWLIPNCESYILDKMTATTNDMYEYYRSKRGHRRPSKEIPA